MKEVVMLFLVQQSETQQGEKRSSGSVTQNYIAARRLLFSVWLWSDHEEHAVKSNLQTLTNESVNARCHHNQAEDIGGLGTLITD